MICRVKDPLALTALGRAGHLHRELRQRQSDPVDELIHKIIYWVDMHVRLLGSELSTGADRRTPFQVTAIDSNGHRRT